MERECHILSESEGSRILIFAIFNGTGSDFESYPIYLRLDFESYPVHLRLDLDANACFFIYANQFQDPSRTGSQNFNELTELVRSRIVISRSWFGTEVKIIDFKNLCTKV